MKRSAEDIERIAELEAERDALALQLESVRACIPEATTRPQDVLRKICGILIKPTYLVSARLKAEWQAEEAGK